MKKKLLTLVFTLVLLIGLVAAVLVLAVLLYMLFVPAKALRKNKK